MTPNLLQSLAATPAVPGLPVLQPAGESGGDNFAELLAGLQRGNLPAPAPDAIPSAKLPAGAALPDGRQDPAAALPVDAMLNDGGGDILTVVEPGAPGAAPVLPEPMVANLPAPAPASKLRTLLVARPLPAPIAIASDPAPAPVGEDPDVSASKAPGIALRPEAGFGPEAAPLMLARTEPATAAPVRVAARVADTPAFERAAVSFDPARGAVPVGPAAGATPLPLTAETALAPVAAPASPNATDPMPASGVEPVPVDMPDAPVASAPPAKPVAPERATSPLPPAFAGLTPATPQGRGPRLEPRAEFRPTPRGRTAIDAPVAPATPLAPAAPLAPMMAAPVAPVAPALEATAPRAEPAAPALQIGAQAEPRAAAPVAAAAPTAPPLLDTARAEWLQGMIDQISELRDAGGSRAAQIRLSPDALGAVEIRVEERDDGVHVTFTADTAQARALLTDAAPRLHDLAEARGLRLAQANVDAGGSGDRRPGQPPQQASIPPAPARGSAATDPAPGRVRDRLA